MYVAGTGVLQKKLKCGGVEADDLAALTVVLLGDKDIDQLADLPMTAAERRDVNIANAEPVEEVVPQRPVGLRRDVAVGRGHKPHVAAQDRKNTRLNSSPYCASRLPSSA